eukprot:230633_1
MLTTREINHMEASQEESKMKQSLSSLQPLLQSDMLSEKQKHALKHVVNHCSQESDDYRVPYTSPFISNPRETVIHFLSSHFGIKWYPLMIATFVICISSFTYGYVTVQTSLIIDPSTPISIGAINYNYHLSQFEKKSLIPSSSLIGAAIGSMSMLFYPSVKYGRKRILLLSNIPTICGCIICVTSVSSGMAIIGFIIVGIGFGISSVVAPVMLAEIAPTPIRSFITTFHQLFITLGILMASVITLPLIQVRHGWRYIVSVTIPVSILQLILRNKIPESPRWLIAAGKPDKAKKFICKIYKGKTSAQHEYDHIYKYITSNEHVANDELTKMREWIWPLFVNMMLAVFGQWTGINVVMYRSQDALQNQQISENIFVSIIIIYLINFISQIISVICVKRNDVSNKTLVYIGTCMMLVSSLFLGLINNTYHGNQHLVDQLSISQLPLYVFGFAISLGVIQWIVMTESFPLCNRLRFASIIVFTQWLCNAALSLSLDTIIRFLTNNKSDKDFNSGVANLCFIFCAIIALCIVFVWKYIPKTKGYSLEDCVKMYNRHMIFAN